MADSEMISYREKSRYLESENKTSHQEKSFISIVRIFHVYINVKPDNFTYVRLHYYSNFSN